MAARSALRLASSFASAASALSVAADADSRASSRLDVRPGRSAVAPPLRDLETDEDLLGLCVLPVFSALPGGASAPPLCSDATLSGACRNAASFESTGWVKSTLKSLCVARFLRKKAMTRKL